MTEFSENLKVIYEKFDASASTERKRSFTDLFKGWFTGRGRSPHPDDTAFISNVEELTDKIKDVGDSEDALSAALVMLSYPKGKKFSEQDIVFAAMYKNVIKLVPMLKDEDVVSVNDAANKVLKQYRFPVYKELITALNERLNK